MLIVRLIVILSIIAIAGGVVAYFLTGEKRYLRFSWNTLRFGVIAGVLLLLFLGLERFLVAPL